MSDYTVRHGEIVKVTSETLSTVTGGGIGGVIYKGIAIAPVSVGTSHRKITEVWAKDIRGEEWIMRFEGYDVPVREGHKVGVLYLRGETIWAIRNHSASRTDLFTSAESLTPKVSNWGCLVPVILVIVGVPIAIMASLIGINIAESMGLNSAEWKGRAGFGAAVLALGTILGGMLWLVEKDLSRFRRTKAMWEDCIKYALDQLEASRYPAGQT